MVVWDQVSQAAVELAAYGTFSRRSYIDPVAFQILQLSVDEHTRMYTIIASDGRMTLYTDTTTVIKQWQAGNVQVCNNGNVAIQIAVTARTAKHAVSFMDH